MHKESLDAVLLRLMTVFAVDSDSELARRLNVNRQTLGSWRARQSIPYSICISSARKEGVALDWLLTGDGEMFRDISSVTKDFLALQPQEEALIALFRSLGEAGKRELQSIAEEKKRLMDVEQQLKELIEVMMEHKRPA